MSKYWKSITISVISENLHWCKCGGEFLAWTVLFIHIISCCSGGGSKQESPVTDPSQTPGGISKQGSSDTDPSKTSGGSSKQESSDTDPSQTPGKTQVKNRLGHILLIVFVDSQTHYFFYYLLFYFNTSLWKTKFSIQE